MINSSSGQHWLQVLSDNLPLSLRLRLRARSSSHFDNIVKDHFRDRSCFPNDEHLWKVVIADSDPLYKLLDSDLIVSDYGLLLDILTFMSMYPDEVGILNKDKTTWFITYLYLEGLNRFTVPDIYTSG